MYVETISCISPELIQQIIEVCIYCGCSPQGKIFMQPLTTREGPAQLGYFCKFSIFTKQDLHIKGPTMGQFLSSIRTQSWDTKAQDEICTHSLDCR